ncbi:MAG: hypothetical protein AABZ06_04935 [Bdellovibrionota bacterium]
MVVLPRPLRLSIACLHVSAVLYVVFAISLIVFSFLAKSKSTASDEQIFISYCVSFFFFAIAVIVEIIIHGIKRFKHWAWVAGIILCVVYIPGILIIFGIIGLRGLLAMESRVLFQRI